MGERERALMLLSGYARSRQWHAETAQMASFAPNSTLVQLANVTMSLGEGASAAGRRAAVEGSKLDEAMLRSVRRFGVVELGVVVMASAGKPFSQCSFGSELGEG